MREHTFSSHIHLLDYHNWRMCCEQIDINRIILIKIQDNVNKEVSDQIRLPLKNQIKEQLV